MLGVEQQNRGYHYLYLIISLHLQQHKKKAPYTTTVSKLYRQLLFRRLHQGFTPTLSPKQGLYMPSHDCGLEARYKLSSGLSLER